MRFVSDVVAFRSTVSSDRVIIEVSSCTQNGPTVSQSGYLFSSRPIRLFHNLQVSRGLHWGITPICTM